MLISFIFLFFLYTKNHVQLDLGDVNATKMLVKNCANFVQMGRFDLLHKAAEIGMKICRKVWRKNLIFKFTPTTH